MMLRTLNDVLLKIAGRGEAPIMLQREATGWVPVQAQEFCNHVTTFAAALAEWGIGKGDRVAILGENRPEWAVADFASLLLGAVTVPLYTTLTASQSAAQLRDAGARIAVLSTAKQLEKLLPVVDQTPVERLVVMDAVDTARAFPMPLLWRERPAANLADLERAAAQTGPDDLATLIYTSGTTGESKGAMLTHGNMASNINYSLQGFDLQSGDISISCLPLSHVTARHADLAMLYHGVMLAYCPFLDQLPQAFLEVKPTIVVAVPRIYEKIFSAVEQNTRTPVKRRVYQTALAIGRKHRDETLAGRTPSSRAWKLADRLVFSQVRAGTGGRTRIFISGGAPLGRSLAEWFADIGIRIHEGYGLTETSPVISVNTPGAHKLGSVGKPLQNVQVRIAPDGEVLVRGPSVFRGYWKQPEATRAAFDGDWFKTGDIGDLDHEGYLSITDRKKDLIKTSGGKFIAPQPIEASLKLNPLVGAAVVVGDKRRFPAVIVSPYFPLLEDWARTNQVPFGSRGELVSSPQVRTLFEGIVDSCNQNLAQFEKLKRVLVIEDEFTAENGALTPTLKLRRRVVEERYRQMIDSLYGP